MIRLFRRESSRTDLICITKAKRVDFSKLSRADSISHAWLSPNHVTRTLSPLIRDARQPQRQLALKRANLSPQLTSLANKPICRSIKRRKKLKNETLLRCFGLFAAVAGEHRIIALVSRGVGQQRAEISRIIFSRKLIKKNRSEDGSGAGESGWLLLLSAQFSVVNSPKHCRKRKLRTFPPNFPPNHAFWWFGVSWHRSFPVSQLFYVNSFDSIIILNSMLWFMARDPGRAGFRFGFLCFHVFVLLTITQATLTEVFSLFPSSCDTNDVAKKKEQIFCGMWAFYGECGDWFLQKR